jgi:hypothetical protein
VTGAPRAGGACEALAAAALVVGEYASECHAAGITPIALCESMLQSAATALPGHVQAQYVQATLKLFAHVASGACRQLPGGSVADETALLTSLRLRLVPFGESQHLEVQVRACRDRASCRRHTRSVRASPPSCSHSTPSCAQRRRLPRPTWVSSWRPCSTRRSSR